MNEKTSKSDFMDWRQEEVTERFFAAAVEWIEGVKNELATSAGLDPVLDNYRRGYIQALLDILEARPYDD